MLDKFKKIYFQVCKEQPFFYGNWSSQEFTSRWNELVSEIVEKKDIKRYSIIGLVSKYTNSNYDNTIKQFLKWEKEFNHD